VRDTSPQINYQKQMNEKITQVKTFVNENVSSELLKNIGISTAILFVVIVSQLILHEVVMVVDSIPVFNGIMEIIGLVAFINFTRNNLITAEQRGALVEKIQNTFNEVIA
jgi:hypothetical protein